MHLKDYYGLLEIKPSAGFAEVKKAYRRLAHQFHPDKTGNDPYSAARFAEIKEAYEVLTNPSKKEVYLQRRWYQQSTGSKRTEGILTPETILKQALELERYISKLDVFRMDKAGLHDYIADLVSPANIEKLNSFNDRTTNDEITRVLLSCLQPLSLPYVLPLYEKLSRLHTSVSIREKLDAYIVLRQKTHKRDRYKIWIILVIVIATCLLIFFLGQ